MRTQHLTALGRSIDLRYPTNLAIVLIGGAVAAGATLIQLALGLAGIEALWWGFRAGATAFGAWVLGRELDPDHARAAFVAAAAATAGLLTNQLPDLIALLWLVLLIRSLNQTTGLAPTTLDTISIVGLGSWMALTADWSYAAVTSLGVLLSAESSPTRLRQMLAAALAALVALVLVGLSGFAPPALTPAAVLAAGAALLMVPLIRDSRHPSSVGDHTGERLSGVRVQRGQITALIAGLLVVLVEGAEGLYAQLPLWAAVLGVSIAWGVRRMTQGLRTA